ncbi:hypothetical protein PENTCL1PPCAC_21004, partial [Pristionchus entomophagus]
TFTLLVAAFFKLDLAQIHYSCPDNYFLVDAGDDHWCFTSNRDIEYGYNEALQYCNDTGDSLPILASGTVNDAITARINEFDIVWIGLSCNGNTCITQNKLNFTHAHQQESSKFQSCDCHLTFISSESGIWEDGESLDDFTAFEVEPGWPCDDSHSRYALRKNGRWRIFGPG